MQVRQDFGADSVGATASRDPIQGGSTAPPPCGRGHAVRLVAHHVSCTLLRVKLALSANTYTKMHTKYIYNQPTAFLGQKLETDIDFTTNKNRLAKFTVEWSHAFPRQTKKPVSISKKMKTGSPTPPRWNGANWSPTSSLARSHRGNFTRTLPFERDTPEVSNLTDHPPRARVTIKGTCRFPRSTPSRSQPRRCLRTTWTRESPAGLRTQPEQKARCHRRRPKTRRGPRARSRHRPKW